MPNKFVQASQQERQLMESMFLEAGVDQYWFTDDESFDQYDGKYIYEDKKVIFEVKVRNIPSTQFRTTIINKEKYDFLVNYCKESPDVHPYIFVFFSDEKVFRADLLKDEVNFITRKAPQTTMGNQTMIEKVFAEFKIDTDKLYVY